MIFRLIRTRLRIVGSLFVAAGAVCLLVPSALAQPATRRADGKALKLASKGIAALQRWYDPAKGLYNTAGWWNSANATTVLVDYARLSNEHQYDSVLDNTFTAAQKTSAGFLNNFYDDEGWWALAWIDAYDLTHDARYLTMARSIFADMAGGWDDTCGGGIWWSKDRKYKNAIANELFLSVAAHLAARDKEHHGDDLNWARKEWAWFAQSGMINDQKLVNDGLRIERQGSATTCVNNKQTTWSYNQGVVLGGLTELAGVESDTSLMKTAQEIADAAITHLTDKTGILHDPCEPKCGGDGPQFKGIFVRNLAALYLAEPRANYRSFIDKNAESIWKHDRKHDQFGVVWSGPFTTADAATQSSALDALVSAAEVDAQAK